MKNGVSVGEEREEEGKCISGILIPDAQRNNEIINKKEGKDRKHSIGSKPDEAVSHDPEFKNMDLMGQTWVQILI